MRLTRSLQITALSLGTLALPVMGHCQIYQFSESVPAFGIKALCSMSNWSGFLPNCSGGSLTGDIYIDPVAPTIRLVGSLSLPSYSLAWSNVVAHTETIVSNIPATFPNPPSTVIQVVTNAIDVLTVNWSTGSNSLSFDTGVRPLSWWTDSAWTFDGFYSLQGHSLPVDFSWSLLTDGQTYAGSSQTSVPLDRLSFGWYVNALNYPSSIYLRGGPYVSTSSTFETTVWDFTAPNGLHASIQIVPEPSNLLILGCGLFGLTLLRRRGR